MRQCAPCELRRIGYAVNLLAHDASEGNRRINQPERRALVGRCCFELIVQKLEVTQQAGGHWGLWGMSRERWDQGLADHKTDHKV